MQVNVWATRLRLGLGKRSCEPFLKVTTSLKWMHGNKE